MLLLALAALYFIVVTLWLIRQRKWKQALATLIIVLAFAGFISLSMNLEMVDGQLRWIRPQN
jgi:hypothetical protein